MIWLRHYRLDFVGGGVVSCCYDNSIIDVNSLSGRTLLSFDSPKKPWIPRHCEISFSIVTMPILHLAHDFTHIFCFCCFQRSRIRSISWYLLRWKITPSSQPQRNATQRWKRIANVTVTSLIFRFGQCCPCGLPWQWSPPLDLRRFKQDLVLWVWGVPYSIVVSIVVHRPNPPAWWILTIFI